MAETHQFQRMQARIADLTDMVVEYHEQNYKYEQQIRAYQKKIRRQDLADIIVYFLMVSALFLFVILLLTLVQAQFRK